MTINRIVLFSHVFYGRGDITAGLILARRLTSALPDISTKLVAINGSLEPNTNLRTFLAQNRFGFGDWQVVFPREAEKTLAEDDFVIHLGSGDGSSECFPKGKIYNLPLFAYDAYSSFSSCKIEKIKRVLSNSKEIPAIMPWNEKMLAGFGPFAAGLYLFDDVYPSVSQEQKQKILEVIAPSNTLLAAADWHLIYSGGAKRSDGSESNNALAGYIKAFQHARIKKGRAQVVFVFGGDLTWLRVENMYYGRPKVRFLGSSLNRVGKNGC